MEISKLVNYTKGWFVGNFKPTCLYTDAVEVAVKTYKAGDKDAAHYHKVATEVTEIVSGKVRMNDQIFCAGDIIKVLPGEVVEFEALEDSTNVVIKVPAIPGDKYVSQ